MEYNGNNTSSLAGHHIHNNHYSNYSNQVAKLKPEPLR
jgi:hypothetical protein